MSEPSHAHALCAALNRHDKPCERQSLPDAPFPICVEHAAEVLRFLNQATERQADIAIKAAREIEAADNCEWDIDIPPRGVSVVYYVRIGQYIKIGHSSDLRTRIRFYPPDTRLLATEPGDRILEGKRLHQFRGTLRDRDEWFTPSVPLLEHIKRLAAINVAAA